MAPTFLTVSSPSLDARNFPFVMNSKVLFGRDGSCQLLQVPRAAAEVGTHSRDMAGKHRNHVVHLLWKRVGQMCNLGKQMSLRLPFSLSLTCGLWHDLDA
jgi:hypothetical protein